MFERTERMAPTSLSSIIRSGQWTGEKGVGGFPFSFIDLQLACAQ